MCRVFLPAIIFGALPLSSLDPFGAVFFKAIYAGRSANVAFDALRAALEAKTLLISPCR
jgi:hypothetical protein